MKMVDGKAVETWGAEDVKHVARTMGVEMSDGEAEAILARMCGLYDASVGCNWDFIRTVIEQERG